MSGVGMTRVSLKSSSSLLKSSRGVAFSSWIKVHRFKGESVGFPCGIWCSSLCMELGDIGDCGVRGDMYGERGGDSVRERCGPSSLSSCRRGVEGVSVVDP
jgi:hypothetical protein